MSNGSILAVWNSWIDGKRGLRYALLSDVNLNVVVNPTDLVNPFSPRLARNRYRRTNGKYTTAPRSMAPTSQPGPSGRG
jgi:hypothetical protein